MPRGGARAGAGRHEVEYDHRPGERPVKRTISLTAAEWDYIEAHAVKGVSAAVRALLNMERNKTPNGEPLNGWARRKDYERKFR